MAIDERLHRPDKVWQINTVHRRAVADCAIKEEDFLIWILRS
jgi:hypothetical protein